jgi:predicted ATPase
MMTLTGVGGVGKTRLALEVAARSVHDFPDGVWVIELASVNDPAAVPEAVAAVLGIVQQAGMSVADSVAAALEGRSRLLVFDNCEHVLDAAADMIDAIFAHSQTVKVLATSREGLRVADEHLWSVPSLDLADGIDSSAAALFVERAEAVAHGPLFDQTHDAQAVVEICRQLDGIPLGIELAASRMQSMTATEVRDRLGDRFRLLVGSRRGLERHQTLRHAVQWSYDLLDDAEKSLLDRCSVFAGGFDLSGAQAVTASDDEFATLHLLDALVRKSLLVTNRSYGQTRFTMLETIRQFAEERLVLGGAADDVRTAHARHFAGREADVLALWDGPTQREAYEWFGVELANLRAAFRWSADLGDLDIAAAIAIYAAFLGRCVQQHEPITWAEELIEPARTNGHRLLARLYMMSAQCYLLGRVDDGLRYADACLEAIDSGRFDEVPQQDLTWLGGLYLARNEPERWVTLCRDMYRHGEDTRGYVQACLALALSTAGADDEARAVSRGLLAIADTADNPHVASYILLGYGMANRHADPVAAYGVHRQGLEIAQRSGNRELESYHAGNAARLAANQGEINHALENLRFAIQVWQDSGAYQIMSSGHAVLAALLIRLGQYESAAILSAAGDAPFVWASYPEFKATITHLRELLDDDTYESFVRIGANMTNAARANYALDQIDRALAGQLSANESS